MWISFWWWRGGIRLSAPHPTWRTGVPLFAYRRAQNLSSMVGPISSWTAAHITGQFADTPYSPCKAKICVQQSGSFTKREVDVLPRFSCQHLAHGMWHVIRQWLKWWWFCLVLLVVKNIDWDTSCSDRFLWFCLNHGNKWYSSMSCWAITTSLAFHLHYSLIIILRYAAL